MTLIIACIEHSVMTEYLPFFLAEKLNSLFLNMTVIKGFHAADHSPALFLFRFRLFVDMTP